MNQSRADFIGQLVTDAQSHPKAGPYPIMRLLLVWWLVSWLFTVAVTLWSAPLRPGALEQLVSHGHFAVETAVGLISGFLVSALALRAAIPGANRRTFVAVAIASFIVWVGSYVAGLFTPALEPSFAGMRVGCDRLTFVLGLPPLAAGLWILSRGYVLHWGLAGLGLGLAAGCMPALFMQLACMYIPRHILTAHIGPALWVAAVGGVAGMAIHFYRQRARRR